MSVHVVHNIVRGIPVRSLRRRKKTAISFGIGSSRCMHEDRYCTATCNNASLSTPETLSETATRFFSWVVVVGGGGGGRSGKLRVCKDSLAGS